MTTGERLYSLSTIGAPATAMAHLMAISQLAGTTISDAIEFELQDGSIDVTVLMQTIEIEIHEPSETIELDDTSIVVIVEDETPELEIEE